MILSKPYNRPEFLDFLKEFLPDFEKDIAPVNLVHNFKTISGATYLGHSDILDVDIYEFETIGNSHKKVSQAIESFKVAKQQMSFKSLISYRSTDDENWRFALLQMTPDVTEKGKIATNFSNPRRYSFLLGPQAKIKTPEKYLIKDGKVKDFEDLQKRFSVEVVNKDFYREIARFFIRLVGGDTKLGSRTEHFKPELNLPSVDPSDHKTYQEYTVRLIGRVIFCWFLKQKKSNEGVSLLPDEFLSSNAVSNNEDYYHTILEPIFFEVLNKPRESRKPQFRNGYDRIPYLNGGLFDPHYDDFYEGQPSYALKIPSQWFKDLFEVLETYNFTIDENTSLDVDLSIDPEMLGRIFENLLAEINPDTGESARKSTGSYYTPRQIVEYMVDQSLIQYLITKTEIAKEKIEALVSVDATDDEEHPLNDNDKCNIIKALDEVKIIDPACGSGAFPIGILQKIVWILSKVDGDGKLWFNRKTENLDHILQEKLEKEFLIKNFDYIRKIGVIKDSIFGIDILPIAVEVSKLRCFLTLIVDEQIDDQKNNRGIEPLPNLEFKFVSANTLVNLPGSLNDTMGQTTMFEEINEIEQLKKVRDKYFTSNGFEKDSVKMEFYRVQKMMFDKQISHGRSGIGQLTMALARWDPFKNASSEWFDSEWMFGMDSFDIVIANPPYVDYRKIDSKTKESVVKYLSNKNSSKPNLYIYFIEKGFDLLKDGGNLCFINPNYFLSADSAFGIRKILADSTRINFLLDASTASVFSAGTYTFVWQFSKKRSVADDTTSILEMESVEPISIRTRKALSKSDILTHEKLVIPISENTELLKKIEKNSTQLAEYAPNFFWGTSQTGYGKKKISSSEYEALTSDDKAKYRKIIQTADIKKYRIIWQEEYIPANIFPSSIQNKFDQDKIVIARLTKSIQSAYDKDKYFVGKSSIILNPKIPYHVILALLNSKLGNYWFREKFHTLHMANGYLRFDIPYLKQMPINNFILEKNNLDMVIDYVNLLISGPNNDQIFNDTSEKLDKLLYKIYHLSESEIKNIEESF